LCSQFRPWLGNNPFSLSSIAKVCIVQRSSGGADRADQDGIPCRVACGVVPDFTGRRIVVNSTGLCAVPRGSGSFDIRSGVQHIARKRQAFDVGIGQAVEEIAQYDGVIGV